MQVSQVFDPFNTKQKGKSQDRVPQAPPIPEPQLLMALATMNELDRLAPDPTMKTIIETKREMEDLKPVDPSPTPEDKAGPPSTPGERKTT